jgi:alpha-tubulin suppressor-like RCC1 family protein
MSRPSPTSRLVLLGVLSGCADDYVSPPTSIELVAFSNDDATCSIEAGVLRCWGINTKGLLGYGHTQDVGDDEDPCALGPVDVGGEVRALYRIGGANRCAILDSGQARCWGASFSGEAYTSSDELPRAGVTLSAERQILQLVASSDHACALLDGGVVRCWGEAAMLGHGDGIDRGLDQDVSEVLDSLPDVPLGGQAITLVAGSSGGSHTCALLDSGSVRCWGTEDSLGYGNEQVIGDDETPEQAGDVPLGGPATSLVGINGSRCALLEDGTLRCWGRSASYGTLGYGDIFFSDTDRVGDDETPADMGPVPVGEPVQAVFMGGLRTCVLLEGGRLRCWGDSVLGVLGYGPDISRLYEPPQEDIELGGPVRGLAMGRNHSCAVLDEGIRCWGRNDYGQLGLGDTSMVGVDGVPAEAPLRPSCGEP